MNSNWSLKFPRTYREATGMDCNFQQRDPDRIVGFVCAVCAAFIVGLMIGGVL